ncbi:MAG: ankyrin repeat domain-containing protein [Magnetococcales bacterium]|nr:ankyrin repeat domain-containing protein [Magnetococcales bacterium]MBF0151369.1 ankyrin repeat domain-containing protein [Magnetococcales bacterium]
MFLFRLLMTAVLTFMVGILGGSDVYAKAEENQVEKLWLHAVEGNPVGVKKALDQGADVNAPSKSGMTPLMWAVQEGHDEIAGYLLKKGADVNAFHLRGGCSALILAAEWLRPTMVDLLIDNGADINFKTKRQWTAILKTADLKIKDAEEGKKQMQIAQTLLSKGADVKAVNSEGRTPLILAANRGNVEMVQLLLKQGAEVDAKDTQGYTALMMAALAGQDKVITILMDNKANPETKHACGCTALMFAAEKGHDKAVQALIDKGADVNAKSEEGMTALMLASKSGHVDAVATLIAAKALVNEMNKEGATARLLATEFGHDEVQMLLKEAGGRCL